MGKDKLAHTVDEETKSATIPDLFQQCVQNKTAINQDPKEAVKQYKIGVAKENLYSQILLGDCYRHGTGIDKNVQEAYNLYLKACDQLFMKPDPGELYFESHKILQELSEELYQIKQAKIDELLVLSRKPIVVSPPRYIVTETKSPDPSPSQPQNTSVGIVLTQQTEGAFPSR